jgi:serine/threonine-protein kinase
MTTTMTGKLLDERYELLEVIGEGGMGVVYEGRHIALGRKVAVKILGEEFSAVDQATQRFMQEAQIAGSLGHPNICEVTDVGSTAEGLPYMVMQYLEGRTLSELIEESAGGLSAARALDIVVQMLSALQVAHEAGIVHRDLKPENIFLTRMGDRADFVKILDFGISKVVGARAQDLQKLTATGMVLGTPYYMAPEQAAGEKDLDVRVDIYAVGVLLFELLVGCPPYEADSYNELIVKIVNEPVPRVCEHNPQVSRKLERVVYKAMAKDREQRYDTVRDFRGALLKAGEDAGLSIPLHLSTVTNLDKNPLSSAAAEVTDRMPTVNLGLFKRHRRRWGWIAGGVAAVAVVVIGIVAFGSQRKSSPSSVGGSGPKAAMRRVRPAMRRVAPPPVMQPRPNHVRIRFVGLPAGGKIIVNGQQIEGTSIDLLRGTLQLPFRAEATGKLPITGLIQSDRDREVELAFKPLPFMDAMGMDAMGMDAMGMDAMGMDAMGMDAMGMDAMDMAPAMRWGFIRGRQGTNVKTNYDDSD